MIFVILIGATLFSLVFRGLGGDALVHRVLSDLPGGTSGAILAGVVFNALLITRAPLQLFQAIQTTLLPHLSTLQTSENEEEFRHALRVIVAAIAGFAALVVLGLAAIGPWAMGVLFGGGFEYERVGLVLVGLGMGFHLTSGTLNQAALARGRAAWAAGAWLAAAALFLIWLAFSPLSDELLAVEVGYAASTAALAASLWWIERLPSGTSLGMIAVGASDDRLPRQRGEVR
jgi:O-antigen/teichoic acid export membrane protein